MEATVVGPAVRNVRGGTAHLVTESRPAVCFDWSYGPVLLDFEDAESRDRAFTELLALSSAVDHGAGAGPKPGSGE